jgi:hypothetical protein
VVRGTRSLSTPVLSFIRELFPFPMLHGNGPLICLGAGVVSVLWFERRIVGSTNDHGHKPRHILELMVLALFSEVSRRGTVSTACHKEIGLLVVSLRTGALLASEQFTELDLSQRLVVLIETETFPHVSPEVRVIPTIDDGNDQHQDQRAYSCR